MKAMGLSLHHLATWWDVLEVCRERPYFPEAALSGVRKFLEDPVGWSRAHGGVGSLEEALAHKGGKE
jgi:orotate phosphoribosyltransferase